MAAASTNARPYRGIAATDRLARRRASLLEAGLELLGHETPAELTVRTICGRAGVAARYFYESFAQKDELIAAVFDQVTAELAITTQAAVAAAPPHQQNRAGITNIVRTIGDDPRIGRLLFDPQPAEAAVVRLRVESRALFAILSGQHVANTLRIRQNGRVHATAHFVVGGVGQTIGAWLTGGVQLAPEQLVDQLTSLLDEFAHPNLYHD